ncbi:MAG: sigma-70 family RNA polymerase sigma factor [Alcanivorax sp.]|uniref:sigma-70 family RNA polymerase sigma factor n=1 Tax=Alloalcanivorax marinus TaxID=1177169 RepID=UPI00195EE615|nr:sigma-70 family RNA polymerase sigma factor [Alloalcanivorax marinus]MBM7335186.1 sigma-70 family RNA polymerase sigma factor [Alloalcanivorax marinus]
MDTSESIADLYTDHHGWLQRLLRRRLGCSETAADLAQDAFLRLLARPRRFDSPAGARAYLSRMARGMCVDLWRRREIEQAWLAALAEQPEPLAPSAEDRVLVLETLCQVDAMLRRLPEKVARAFLMAQLHGRSYKAIGAALRVSERTVKKYMARAMLECALLEVRLQREEDGHAAPLPAPVDSGAGR